MPSSAHVFWLAFLAIFPLDALTFYMEATGTAPPLPTATLGFVLAILGTAWYATARVDVRMVVAVGLVGAFVLFALSRFALTGQLGEHLSPLWPLRVAATFLLGWHLCRLVRDGMPSIAYAAVLLIVSTLAALVMLIGDAFQPGYNYLRIADAVAVSSIVLICVSRSLAVRALLSAGAIVLLFFIGSRLAIVAFVCAMASYFVVETRHSGFASVKAILAPPVFTVATLAGLLFFGPDTRLQRLIFTPEQDTSLMVRAASTREAVDTIRDNPLMGDVCYYCADSALGYSHELISYWADFGLGGLLYSLLIVAVLIAAGVWASRLRRDDPTPAYGLVLSLVAYWLIAILVARYWGFTQFYVAMGAAVWLISTRARVRRQEWEGVP